VNHVGVRFAAPPERMKNWPRLYAAPAIFLRICQYFILLITRGLQGAIFRSVNHLPRPYGTRSGGDEKCVTGQKEVQRDDRTSRTAKQQAGL
jgi:hypothetical protein